MDRPVSYLLWVFKIILASILALTGVAVFAAQDSTVFTYDGQDFIRVQTTMATEDGKSAVNTKLDRDSPVFQALVQKRSYTGDATIFGQNYEAYYAPLTDEGGQLTGALFVGIKK